MNKAPKWYLSWPVIITLLIIFAPVGLVLLFIRLGQGSNDSGVNGYKLRKISIGIMIFFGLGLFAGLQAGSSEDFLVFVFCLVALLVGVILFRHSNRLIAQSRIHQRLHSIIFTQNISSISQLATIIQMPEGQVYATLQRMIEKGVLGGAYIDHQNYSIVAPGLKATQDVRPKPVKCISCGAITTFIANVAEKCCYCGSPISEVS